MNKRHISFVFAMSTPALAVGGVCDSAAQCNQAGTAAYQANRLDEAIESFERQLRRVEGVDISGLELALNNLIVVNLRAGRSGMARAWLEVALDNNLAGSATRHNLASVTRVLDYPALEASPEGRYLRYAGQAAWSEVVISADGQGGYHASFAAVRAGQQYESYGPAAIGELQGRLRGDARQMRLESADLSDDCAVQLLREGLRLQVLEVFAPGCQDYAGMGISLAGSYLKVQP
ncbi:tetratricopeptide repeat protein [Pseudomonas sp. NCCP-436]|uniref:tetratricopeptide repeat protein n=1 Tax=Pseudomonas sp. NCCP-436 TaxID=2842481 RepID=UPI001C80F016|nr:tetratricopeptide repeat protein [Pseudomonas sp. NCCP-436]GIZ10807.1 hypothetical protein NCCP436_02230 [Pseudomonas sp. NCCP-436]